MPENGICTSGLLPSFANIFTRMGKDVVQGYKEKDLNYGGAMSAHEAFRI